MNIQASPLNPINFTEVADVNSGELQREYVQQFKSGDRITLQFIGQSGLTVIALVGGEPISTGSSWLVGNETVYLLYIETSTLPQGELLSVVVRATDTENYALFYSKSYIEVLEECDSALVEYTNDSNVTAFNTYFNNGNIKFQIRIPMGFKSTSYNERVVSETFRNQRQELRHLYAFPYETKTLIIGSGLGVPHWIAKLVNFIFCLSSVTVDGEKLIRSEDSVPERQGGIDGYPLHVYNITVESHDDRLDYEFSLGDFNNDFNYDFMV